MTLPILLIWTLWAVSSHPERWECQNDLEIQCTAEGCDTATEGDFTPMNVTIDDAGFMQVCAYSGCWEGTGMVTKSKGFVMLTGHDLPFSTSPDSVEMQESIVIVLDQTDGVATLKAGAFAHPLRCERVVQE